MPSDTATAMQTTVVDQWAKGHNVGKYVEPQKLMPLSKGYYGAPFVKILYLTDLAQKLLSSCIYSYLCREIAKFAQR